MATLTQHASWKAYTALAFGVLCIGLSAIFVKIAAVPGGVSAFYRVLFATIVLVPIWLWKGPARPAPATLRGTIIGGLFFAIDLVLWNTALLLTGAGVATLLANNAPIWVGLIAWLFLHQRVGANFWVGLFLALAGMTLIVAAGGALVSGSGLGNLLAIIASFFYALYLLTTQRVRASMDTLSFMAISMLAATAILFVTNLVMQTPLNGYSLTSYVALLALGLVSQVGGWLSINYALGQLPATQVSVTLLAQAVVTTLVAIPILGELPAPLQVVGGAMVLGGIYWVYRGRG
ncbi:MAG: DMT family transporter [Anaerolineales bacterium]|nr:DMT family transporter [Anaerolineales bacterium]